MVFEKINIVDILVIVGLIIGLIMAIFYQKENLSIGIVGVLGGYIGGSSRPHQNKINEEKVGNSK